MTTTTGTEFTFRVTIARKQGASTDSLLADALAVRKSITTGLTSLLGFACRTPRLTVDGPDGIHLEARWTGSRVDAARIARHLATVAMSHATFKEGYATQVGPTFILFTRCTADGETHDYTKD